MWLWLFMAASPCSDLAMIHVVGEAAIIKTFLKTFLLKPNTLSASDMSRSSRVSPMFFESRLRPSHFVVDTHVLCVILSPLPEWLARWPTCWDFSPSLPALNRRVCQDSWTGFLLRMWEESHLCDTQTIFRHQMLLFCRIDSLFSSMRNLTTFRVLFSDIVFSNCDQRWTSELAVAKHKKLFNDC